MEVKKIVEGMTAVEVAEVINGSFESLDKEKATKAELQAEVTRATNAENALNLKVAAETSRATSAELELRKSINNEVLRAKEAEEELDNNIHANRYGYNVTVNGLKGGIHKIETAIKDVPSKFRMLGQKITFRTENGDWATYHNESLSLDNYENVNDWVQEVGISSVQGDVNITNAPDYEDLTEAKDGTIKFADKEYSAESFSGLGRVYLRKNIVEGVNMLTQDMISKPNTIYIIQYDYDLQGAEITVPEGCVLDFQGGSLSNGVLQCNNTEFNYSSPFIGEDLSFRIDNESESNELDWGYSNKVRKDKSNVYTFNSSVIKDIEIFKSVKHTQEEIEILFNGSDVGKKIVFSNGVYDNVDTIVITRDIDADFSGSTINTKENIVEYTIVSSRVFYQKKWTDYGVSSFKVKNLTIDGGNDAYSRKGNTNRRAIQLFYIDNVELDNVNIRNYNCGSFANYQENIDLRYELHVVSIFEGLTATIKNCNVENTNFDVYNWTPRKAENNYLNFVNNNMVNVHGTMLLVVDGKCNIKHNRFDSYVGSALNVFCYDSDISYNTFKNAGNSVAIDLTETGIYISSNVSIYNNTGENIMSFVSACGNNISVYKNNIISTKKDSQYSICTFTPPKKGQEVYGYISQQNLLREHKINCENIAVVDNVANDIVYAFLCWSGYGSDYGIKGLNVSGNILNIYPSILESSQYSGILYARNVDMENVVITNNKLEYLTENIVEDSRSITNINIQAVKGLLNISNNSIKYTNNRINPTKNYLATINNIDCDCIIFEGNNSNLKSIFTFDIKKETGVLFVKNNKNTLYNNSGIPYTYTQIYDDNLSECMYEIKDSVSFKCTPNNYIIENGIIKYCQYQTYSAKNRSYKTGYKYWNYKYDDGSIWQCVISGTMADIIPDVSSYNIGDTIIDGGATLIKISDKPIVFREKLIRKNDFSAADFSADDVGTSAIIGDKPYWLFFDKNDNLVWKDVKGNIGNIKDYGYIKDLPSPNDIVFSQSYMAVDLTHLDTDRHNTLLWYTGTNDDGTPMWCDAAGNNSRTNFINRGSSEFRPSIPDVVNGYFYYDFTLRKPIWKMQDRWIDANGYNVDEIRYSGTYAENPEKLGVSIPIGFAYFCTDKQTTESLEVGRGIMIYYTGQGKWVDALGRVVE